MYSHHQHPPYIRMILYQSSILCLRAAALLTEYQLQPDLQFSEATVSCLSLLLTAAGLPDLSVQMQPM